MTCKIVHFVLCYLKSISHFLVCVVIDSSFTECSMIFSGTNVSRGAGIDKPATGTLPDCLLHPRVVDSSVKQVQHTASYKWISSLIIVHWRGWDHLPVERTCHFNIFVGFLWGMSVRKAVTFLNNAFILPYWLVLGNLIESTWNFYFTLLL